MSTRTYPALPPVPRSRFDSSYEVVAAGYYPDGRILVLRPDGGIDIQPADGGGVDEAVFETSVLAAPAPAVKVGR